MVTVLYVPGVHRSATSFCAFVSPQQSRTAFLKSATLPSHYSGQFSNIFSPRCSPFIACSVCFLLQFKQLYFIKVGCCACLIWCWLFWVCNKDLIYVFLLLVKQPVWLNIISVSDVTRSGVWRAYRCGLVFILVARCTEHSGTQSWDSGGVCVLSFFFHHWGGKES